MKRSLFKHSMAFGALAILGFVSFSCNDSGNAGYDGSFDPNANTNGVPSNNLGNGANNALTGLGLGQDTLQQVSTATKNGESDSSTPSLDGSKFAATAADGSLTNNSSADGGSNGSGQQSTGSGGSGLVNLTGKKQSSGNASGGASGGGSGSVGGGVASLGDTHTSAMVDQSKSGPNGDGTTSAADALGKSNASDSQGVYAAGGGGQSSGKGLNPFSSLFGGDGNGVGGAGTGNSTTEFGRDPSSIAGQADASPMGSQDPANYFSLHNTGDNLFKIVERRYVSKSKQWAISDAQEIRRSVSR